jgi:hypothetical protein
VFREAATAACDWRAIAKPSPFGELRIFVHWVSELIQEDRIFQTL